MTTSAPEILTSRLRGAPKNKGPRKGFDAPRRVLNVDDINRQARFWCFTVNNPLKQFTERPPHVNYLVSGQEVGKEGTPHLQCYCELDRGQRRAYVQKLFPGAHLEIRYENSTAEQARAYCTKDGKFVEFGEMSVVSNKPGKRTDLQLIATQIDEGTPLQQIALENKATFIRNYRGIQKYAEITHTPQAYRENLKVHLYVGKTRLGKSHHARITLGCFAKPTGKGLWFDGYNREKNVVIDEFRGQYPLADILQITDPYKVQVEVKGGHTWFEPDLLIFTTNKDPSTMYTEHDEESREAFFARFTKVVWFYAKQKSKDLNAAETASLFAGRGYPPIPTYDDEILPLVLMDVPPAPRKLKRQRAALDLEREMAAADARPPPYHYDTETSTLKKAKKPTKINWESMADVRKRLADNTINSPVYDLQDSQETQTATQATQVLDDDDEDVIEIADTEESESLMSVASDSGEGSLEFDSFDY